jgi:fused signal recognition particle receptor
MSEENNKGGWFRRLKSGLSRSSSRLTEGIGAIFTKHKLDDAALEELEELLISASTRRSVRKRFAARWPRRFPKFSIRWPNLLPSMRPGSPM